MHPIHKREDAIAVVERAEDEDAAFEREALTPFSLPPASGRRPGRQPVDRGNQRLAARGDDQGVVRLDDSVGSDGLLRADIE